MARKVSLTVQDLLFISESIGLNVPDEDEMTPAQRRTARKINRAYLAELEREVHA